VIPISKLGEKMTPEMITKPDYESKWVLSETILNAVGCVLDGEVVSDFELSFPIVRQAADMYFELKQLKGD